MVRDEQSLASRPDRRRPSSPFAASSESAFTLVELLVVIGIIAILIAILLPALSAAKRQAQLTQCLSIERQIGMAATLHASQHQGYYPIAGLLAGVPNTGGVTAIPPASVGDVGKRKYMYASLGETFFKGLTLAPWQAALATYMGKKVALDATTNVEISEDEIGSRSYLKYFVCPSHRDQAGDIQNSIVYQGGNLMWMLQQSYVINEAVFGINDKLGRLRGKASRVRQPSRTCMLADGLQSAPRTANWTVNGVNWVTFVNLVATPPISLADALTSNGKAGDAQNFDKLRHRGKVNILFFDGHAETRRVEPGDLRTVYLLSN